jgi:hypothetical protein
VSGYTVNPRYLGGQGKFRSWAFGDAIRKFTQHFLISSLRLKGSVQRKLRLAKGGVYRWGWASDCGVGLYFVILVVRSLSSQCCPTYEKFVKRYEKCSTNNINAI